MSGFSLGPTLFRRLAFFVAFLAIVLLVFGAMVKQRREKQMLAERAVRRAGGIILGYKTIDLIDCELDDNEAIQVIIAITPIRPRALFLSGNNIGDDTLIAIGNMQGLSYLSVDSNSITDVSIKHLCGPVNVRDLSLSWTSVSDACIEDLASMRSLEKVSLNRTKVTSKGVEKLKRLRPELKISHESTQ